MIIVGRRILETSQSINQFIEQIDTGRRQKSIKTKFYCVFVPCYE